MNARRSLSGVGLWSAGGLLLAVGLLAGCDGNTHWTAPDNSAYGPVDTAPRQLSESDLGGEWVIVLEEFSDRDREQQAKALKQQLQASGWTGVGVVHDGDAKISYTFFGPFRYHDRALEQKLDQIHNYTDARGERRFRGAYIHELPGKPVGPAQYDLRHAKGYWTLQAYHFVDPSPVFPATQLMDLPPDWDRRKEAVKACEELRQKGYEAYYYHGPRMSMVTVGTFPKEAFEYDPNSHEYKKYDPEKDDYLDPAVHKLREVFEYNRENGLILYKRIPLGNGQVKKVPQRSFLVEIPRGGPGGYFE
ncbi:MAG: hypothetical protein BIFFINMI_00037 [Phycisphaerae bacterium]|nr:hypothetical protein [Phycisphaerae bacterium]